MQSSGPAPRGSDGREFDPADPRRRARRDEVRGRIVVEHLVQASTPMGPAVPGSRLARVAEGQRLANKLIRDGWRPGYLAEELAIGQGTLVAWRRGQRAPTEQQLQRMRDLVRLDDQKPFDNDAP